MRSQLAHRHISTLAYDLKSKISLPCGYGFAWLGHFVFEKNRPATFQHPFYSLAGDFVMFKDMLIGRIAW